MAQKRISELGAATTPLNGTDEVHLNQGGTSVRADLTDVVSLALAQGWELLETKDVSGVATMDFTSSIDNTREEYILRLYDVIPATDAVHLQLRTSTDGGSTFDSAASHYDYAATVVGASSSSPGVIASTGDSAISMAATSGTTLRVGSDTNEQGWSGQISLVRPSEAGFTQINFAGGYSTDSGEAATVQGSGRRLAAENVDAIRLLFSSGNIESGKAALYGLVNS